MNNDDYRGEGEEGKEKLKVYNLIYNNNVKKEQQPKLLS